MRAGHAVRTEGPYVAADLGVTRLSLGVENFSDAGARGKRSGRISRQGGLQESWEWIRAMRRLIPM